MDPKRTNILQFTTDHALHASHASYYNKLVPSNIVPNFIGGVLPRSDHGDKEYYCATMLTLFKPWRIGHCSKTPFQSWDDAFNAHKFTVQQLSLMKNFNIKYECLDAKDDYRAQMNKKTGDPIHIDSWMSIDDNEIPDNFNISNDVAPDGETIDLNFTESKRYKKRIEQAAMVRNILTNLGWTKVLDDEFLLSVENNTSSEIDKNFEKLPIPYNNDWKSEIEKAKKIVLQRKQQNSAKISLDIPNNPINKKLVVHDQFDVKVVNISFLHKNSTYAKDMKAEVNNITSKFTLNTAQLRAFTIIANHSHPLCSEQLRMYIGSMAGTGKSQVIRSVIEFFKNRNEAHRFAIVAPTGNAAFLLGGTTYHSMFGISDGKRVFSASLNKVKNNMIGVDTIFLDEVSMLSCQDLMKIHRQLCHISNKGDVPFGGYNIIFAGDFA